MLPFLLGLLIFGMLPVGIAAYVIFQRHPLPQAAPQPQPSRRYQPQRPAPQPAQNPAPQNLPLRKLATTTIGVIFIVLAGCLFAFMVTRGFESGRLTEEGRNVSHGALVALTITAIAFVLSKK